MTIQFDPENNRVRVGDKFFPATGFDGNNEPTWYGKGYKIPLGESGKELSVAIGGGTYSDNYHNHGAHALPIDPSVEMREVEVGYDFGDAPSPYEWADGTRGFDVTGWINDEKLLEIIEAAMNGIDPF